MPKYGAGTERFTVGLTKTEATLVNAMNRTAATRLDANIAALHFDGQALIDLVEAHKEASRFGFREFGPC